MKLDMWRFEKVWGPLQPWQSSLGAGHRCIFILMLPPTSGTTSHGFIGNKSGSQTMRILKFLGWLPAAVIFPRKRLKQCNFGSKNLRTIQNLRCCFALASCGRSDHLLWCGTLSIDKLSNLDDSWWGYNTIRVPSKRIFRGPMDRTSKWGGPWAKLTFLDVGLEKEWLETWLLTNKKKVEMLQSWECILLRSFIFVRLEASWSLPVWIWSRRRLSGVAPKILNNSNGVGTGCQNHEIISYPLYYPSCKVVILIYRFTLSCQKMWVRIGRFGWMPNKFPRVFEGSNLPQLCCLFSMWSWSGESSPVSMTWKDVWSTWNHFNILMRLTM